MPSITLNSASSPAGKSFSCSSGGGGGTASTSSIIYIGGNLYCSYIQFANIPTACGSTGPGDFKIKKATLKLAGVEPYSSSVNNSSTNAMRIGISNANTVVHTTSNIYSDKNIYGPNKNNAYFSSTLQSVSLTDVELDVTEQIQAMFDNRNTAGGTVNYHSGNSYIWICANAITGQNKKVCLRVGNKKVQTLVIEYYKTNVKVYDSSISNWQTCGVKVFDSATNSWIECGVKIYDGTTNSWVEI